MNEVIYEIFHIFNYGCEIKYGDISTLFGLVSILQQTFTTDIFSTQLTAPGSPRMWSFQRLKTIGLEAVDFICSFSDLLLNPIGFFFSKLMSQSPCEC